MRVCVCECVSISPIFVMINSDFTPWKFHLFQKVRTLSHFLCRHCFKGLFEGEHLILGFSLSWQRFRWCQRERQRSCLSLYARTGLRRSLVLNPTLIFVKSWFNLWKCKKSNVTKCGYNLTFIKWNYISPHLSISFLMAMSDLLIMISSFSQKHKKTSLNMK